MAQVAEITRKFMFNQEELVDIPNLTPEQIKEHYSAFYPELINSSVRNLGLDNSSVLTYEFQNKAGTKG